MKHSLENIRARNPKPRLFDYVSAAEVLSMSVQGLRDLVYKGKGPTVVRIGRRTYFASEDIDEFIDRHREARG